ncbi:adenylate/guanylate cyclase domain-containing protein [Bradyrhizobium sp. LHD-71]|uniref:CHASE2 domain-containing protein n=1 Tax=Bradyrhizobium sp. LHD-71 TaxID=3072141 RepID=UPI00280F4174|nr:adenylate/guanylate cyclase domain-containing protein [Bradyrhizobium sp. LHD-71]MDQ8732127.1 adenylate/guanylate cyclase domain-containing protein [Bradyrhizobium sp. LHD-71]
MPNPQLAIRTPLLGGLLATAVLTAALLLAPQEILNRAIEPIRDIILRTAAAFMNKPPPATRVVVVDIDSRSLDEVAQWPWPRELVAQLVDRISAAEPSVVAIDILFEHADAHSPAALARQLGARLGRNDLTALAETLPDGDKRLSAAFRTAAVVLGFVLDPASRGSVPAPPIIARGQVDLSDIWRSAGVIGPPDELVQAARGIGALALPGDASAIVRRVPLLVAAGGQPYPGLALESVRVLAGASSYIVDGPTETIQVGDRQFALAPDAMLRLAPVVATERNLPIVSAADIMTDRFDRAALAKSVVMIGGSAPELGGLRPTSFDPVTPSVLVHADAFQQLMRNYVPRQPPFAPAIQLGGVLIAALLALWAALRLRPLAAAITVAALAAIIWGACIALAGKPQLLVDPLLPTTAAFVVFAVVSTLHFAITQQREARVRQRFEQHLAPQVVSLIVSDPNLVKLSGERREITALFTDIEGFTTMTDRLGAEELVSLLDRYFEGVTAIVMKHGGMIDKLVGDAVHAFFNAPLDQAEHWRHAIECGIEIRQWTEAFRIRPENIASAMGKTRIGIETGDAVVGDVGIRAKLDYTAHGNAINIAARLEAANKELGSTICIGAGAATRYGLEHLKPLGKVQLRGLNMEMAVYEPKE